jgi:hypothetical protein
MTEYRDIPGHPGYRAGDDGMGVDRRSSNPAALRKGDIQFSKIGVLHVIP